MPKSFVLVIILSLFSLLKPVAGGFWISNGKIYDPDGNAFIVKGINLGDTSIGSQVTQLFPGINFIRFATGGMEPASYFQGFVDYMTSRKIVVEIEYHPWPLQNASVNQAETDWYSQLASAFKDNAYVWFGTMNEPQGGDISGEQVAVYNAIRYAGGTSIVLMEAGVGAGNPGQTGPAVLDPGSYSWMYNIAWDLHYYGWVTNFNTDQNAVNEKLLGCVGCGTGILSCQEITSKDGKIPVVNAEFGVSTTGQSFDANQDQDVYAVTKWAVQNGYTSGFSGWHWNADPYNALQNNGGLTNWGKELASAIASTYSEDKYINGSNVNVP